VKPKLAIFELHHLGDAVMAIPFLRGARSLYEPVVFCRPSVANFLNLALPELTTQTLPDSWLSRTRYFRRHLEKHAFAAAACVWPDVRAHYLMGLTGAPTRVGFTVEPNNFYAAEIPWRKRRLLIGRIISRAFGTLRGSTLLTNPLCKFESIQHHAQSWRQLAAALGFEVDVRLPWIDPAPFSTPLPQLSFPHAPGPVFALHAGGRLPTKRWQGFQEVLRTFFAPSGLPIVIIGPPDEPHPAPQGPNQVVLPTPDLQTLLQVASQADAFLTNDSFAAHLAAAFGKPVVTIFGSGQPDWFAPFGNRQRVVRSNACPHHPCIDRCVMPSYVCLESIKHSQVKEALDALFQDIRP